jgi:A/G-specific adenine glycosylase
MTLTSTLQDWFLVHQRALPFRTTKDPYRIWISEIMAQQTQIDTMLPYYARWMVKWPTLASLAQAKDEELLKAWEGLGYYTRVRNIAKAARLLHTEQRAFPSTAEAIAQLPGIGPYTAAAIASICFEEKAVAIDGNVYRVVSRIKGLKAPLGSSVLKTDVTSAMTDWMATATPSVFTQAMMELGALVCTPKKPQCAICPLKTYCTAFKQDNVLDYPVKTSTKKSPIHVKIIAIYRNALGQIALTDQHSDTLLKGFYRLPELEHRPENAKPVGNAKHVFSHRVWEMTFVVIEDGNQPYRYVDPITLDHLPVITAHRRFLAQFTTKNVS